MSNPRASWFSGTTLFLVASVAGCSTPRRPPAPLDLVAPELAGTGGPAQSTAFAQQLTDPDAGYNPDFYAKEGVYLSGRYIWSDLSGDFDGETTLQAPGTEVISIADVDDGYGYEVALGWMSKGWAMELSYTDNEYEGTIAGSPADIYYSAITWNGLHYWRANEPLQPYLMIGMLFAWAELENASTHDPDGGGPLGTVTRDADLEFGFGLDGGGGLAWWLSHNLALDVRALFTYQEFDEADGQTISGTIDDPIEGPSWSLSVGLTWVIGKTGGD